MLNFNEYFWLQLDGYFASGQTSFFNMFGNSNESIICMTIFLFTTVWPYKGFISKWKHLFYENYFFYVLVILYFYFELPYHDHCHWPKTKRLSTGIKWMDAGIVYIILYILIMMWYHFFEELDPPHWCLLCINFI